MATDRVGTGQVCKLIYAKLRITPADGLLWFLIATVWGVFCPIVRAWAWVQLVLLLKQPVNSLEKRRFAVYTTFWQCALHFAITTVRAKQLPEEYGDVLWEEMHEANAERVYKLVLGLNGLWIKLAQYISARNDIAPPAYVNRFQAFQDDIGREPFEAVEKTLVAAFGCPVDELFDSLDKEPLASASIAQVHKATLSATKFTGKWAGAQVAVKVQHTGIEPIIKQDCDNLLTMLGFTARVPAMMDMTSVMQAYADEVMLELDFLREVSAQERANGCVHEFARTDGLDNRVLIPPVHPTLRARTAFVMEFVPGLKVTKAGPLLIIMTVLILGRFDLSLCRCLPVRAN